MPVEYGYILPVDSFMFPLSLSFIIIISYYYALISYLFVIIAFWFVTLFMFIV